MTEPGIGTPLAIYRAITAAGMPMAVESIAVGTKRSVRDTPEAVITLWFKWWAPWFMRARAVERVAGMADPHMPAGVNWHVERGSVDSHPVAKVTRLRCAAVVQRKIDELAVQGYGVADLKQVRDAIMEGRV